MSRERRTTRAAWLVAALCLAVAAPLRAQGQGPELEAKGLLRAGFRAEKASLGGTDGFALYDARLGLTGRIGIVFDYRLGAEVDTRDETIRLLDAAIALPLRQDLLRLELGLFPSPFGGEATTPKGELPFVERSQSTLALAPGRQIGAALTGQTLEGRLRYAGGLFNGDGRSLKTADDGFLGVASLTWNSIGDVEFYEDFVWEIGASVGFASDSADVLPVAPAPGAGPDAPTHLLFDGNRTLWGAHGRVSYRAWSVSAEYLRTHFDPGGSADTLASDGWWAQVDYSLWGAFELLARWDDWRPAVAAGEPVATEPDRNRFLILGLNLLPGLYGRLGLQYAIGVDGTELGPGGALDRTNTATALSDGQFLLNLQVDF